MQNILMHKMPDSKAPHSPIKKSHHINTKYPWIAIPCCFLRSSSDYSEFTNSSILYRSIEISYWMSHNHLYWLLCRVQNCELNKSLLLIITFKHLTNRLYSIPYSNMIVLWNCVFHLMLQRFHLFASIHSSDQKIPFDISNRLFQRDSHHQSRNLPIHKSSCWFTDYKRVYIDLFSRLIRNLILWIRLPRFATDKKPLYRLF